jgi:hypothetical protein
VTGRVRKSINVSHVSSGVDLAGNFRKVALILHENKLKNNWKIARKMLKIHFSIKTSDLQTD